MVHLKLCEYAHALHISSSLDVQGTLKWMPAVGVNLMYHVDRMKETNV